MSDFNHFKIVTFEYKLWVDRYVVLPTDIKEVTGLELDLVEFPDNPDLEGHLFVEANEAIVAITAYLEKMPPRPIEPVHFAKSLIRHIRELLEMFESPDQELIHERDIPEYMARAAMEYGFWRAKTPAKIRKKHRKLFERFYNDKRTKTGSR